MRKMKKVLSLIVAMAMVISLGVTAMAATGADLYSDWDKVGDSYKADVLRLSSYDNGLNVFRGKGNDADGKGTFEPTATLTRAELLSMVAIVDIGGNPDKLDLNALFAADNNRGEKFTDVPKEHWAFAAINYAARMGYIEGEGAGKFNPDANVTADALYSLCLSLLGFQAEDKNGGDWVAKVGTLIRTYGLTDINVAVNYEVTRQEVAKVLSKAVDQKTFTRNANNGTYAATGDKLIKVFDASKKDANAIEIEGKVIATKYASLIESNYPHDTIAIWSDKDQKVYQISDAADDVVPMQYLGRYVTLDVVKTSTSGNHYRPAAGAKAEAKYNNDIVKVEMDEKSWTNGIQTANNNSYWYSWYTGQRDREDYDDIRGAYFGYDNSTVAGVAQGMEVAQEYLDRANYAYAVRDPDLSRFSEVFFLEYQAAVVASVSASNKATFEWLCGDDMFDDDSFDLGDIEVLGGEIAKGDIVVGILNKDGDGFVGIEKITPKSGMRHLSRNGVNVDGAWYNRAENLNGGLNEVEFEDSSNTKNYNWSIFTPAYYLQAGSAVITKVNADDGYEDDIEVFVGGAFWTSEGMDVEDAGLVNHKHSEFKVSVIDTNRNGAFGKVVVEGWDTNRNNVFVIGGLTSDNINSIVVGKYLTDYTKILGEDFTDIDTVNGKVIDTTTLEWKAYATASGLMNAAGDNSFVNYRAETGTTYVVAIEVSADGKRIINKDVSDKIVVGTVAAGNPTAAITFNDAAGLATFTGFSGNFATMSGIDGTATPKVIFTVEKTAAQRLAFTYDTASITSITIVGGTTEVATVTMNIEAGVAVDAGSMTMTVTEPGSSKIARIYTINFES